MTFLVGFGVIISAKKFKKLFDVEKSLDEIVRGLLLPYALATEKLLAEFSDSEDEDEDEEKVDKK